MLVLRSSALLLLVGVASHSADFNRDVRPILSDKCYTCHGPDQVQRKTPLRFDTEEGVRVELLSGGKAIVPGKPGESALIGRITAEDPARRMPPSYAGHAKLTDPEIETLREWIADGAPCPEGSSCPTPTEKLACFAAGPPCPPGSACPARHRPRPPRGGPW